TYLMDANIIRFFMNPAKEARQHFGVFGNDDGITTNAMITAEFMLSRGLAGQFHAPAFIAEGHAEDIADIIASLSQAADEPVESPDQRVLRSVVADIENKR